MSPNYFGSICFTPLADVPDLPSRHLVPELVVLLLYGRLDGLDGPVRAALTQPHRARLADLLGKSLYRVLERQGRGEQLQKIPQLHPTLLETLLAVIWPNSKAFLPEALSQATNRLLDWGDLCPDQVPQGQPASLWARSSEAKLD